MQILDIQDDHNSDILLNERLVHLIDTFTIQVERELLNKYSSNKLHILFKKHPELVDSTKEANTQNVDIPIELVECVILGMAAKAHSMGFLSNDPRTGTSYVQNPYIDRYEAAIKKAIDNGFIMPTRMGRKDWDMKGFV